MFPVIDRRPARCCPTRRRKVRAGGALFVLCGVVTTLIGCPLYSDDCDSQNDCASGFYCDRFSGDCEPILDAIGCVRPSECGAGETCTPDFLCRPGSCDYHGCVRGYRCGVVDFAHTCVPAGDDIGSEDASVPPPADAGGSADSGLGLDAGSNASMDAGDASIDAGP
jgi:hypothetical protein